MKIFIFKILILLVFLFPISNNVAEAATLTVAQINSVIALLQSFGADSNAINNVKNVLSGNGAISVPATPSSGPISSPQSGSGSTVPGGCVSTITSTSRIGSTGSSVSALQTFLIQKGYDIPAVSSKIAPKGYYGYQTRDAVTKYQKSEGLTLTGVVDSKTLEKVNYSVTIDSSPENASGCVPPVPVKTYEISIISPNGGESWTKGTTQIIKWQDNTTVPKCPEGAYCMSSAPKLYDIKLATYYPPCAGQLCPAYAYREPYPIINGVSANSYQWNIGKIIDAYGSGETAPDGQYTIQICKSGTNTCDSSDSYFKIISGNTGTRQI